MKRGAPRCLTRKMNPHLLDVFRGPHRHASARNIIRAQCKVQLALLQKITCSQEASCGCSDITQPWGARLFEAQLSSLTGSRAPYKGCIAASRIDFCTQHGHRWKQDGQPLHAQPALVDEHSDPWKLHIQQRGCRQSILSGACSPGQEC